ncbi:MAG: 4Fe-4S dicluster domain-containing protein, partial [Casimicrobiaceae bacterium]
AGFMREQVCKYMCPYARFQSVMFDRDTMIVTYDAARGEPRGSRKKGADAAAAGLGACVDCSLCVQVCPTGIDIRNGLQYECIGCAACIDVCDSVMDKMGYPRGLVRYATENAIENRWSWAEIRAHIMRPRILIYGAVLALLVGGLLASLLLRSPLRVDVIRDARVLAREVEGQWIENVYRLNLMNASEHARRVHVRVEGIEGARIDRGSEIAVAAAANARGTLAVRVPVDALPAGSHPLQLIVESEDDRAPLAVRETTPIVVPR